jgi:hypothetical protein
MLGVRCSDHPPCLTQDIEYRQRLRGRTGRPRGRVATLPRRRFGEKAAALTGQRVRLSDTAKRTPQTTSGKCRPRTERLSCLLQRAPLCPAARSMSRGYLSVVARQAHYRAQIPTPLGGGL